MFPLSVLAAAIAPGLALMAYFYLKDRYESEPVSLVIRMFAFGALLVFPTMVLQRAFVLGFGENRILFSFVYSSFLEEFLKWFLVFFVIYKHQDFNEPYDGIVYAAAVSLGYATVENVIYAFLGSMDFSALLMRALLPVSGHAMFGVIMGYHLGRAKFLKSRETYHLTMALLLPVFYHGIFDYIQLDNRKYWLWLMLPLMAFLWFRSIWKMNKANDISPLRGFIREEEVKIS
ncbi:glutamic-type intramembrane protease PrsW [Gorillibacterium sp. sgz5001074]|uniref:glutamic-type intramembrane protease PrsW n=1 Tax=Gorillibacterium sp. sgz5001074 TaxID=3446695 RepID=UPI003F679A85